MSSLAQQALDLATTVQQRLSAGGDPVTKQNLSDIASAVQLLAENVLGGTPSTDSPDMSATQTDVSINTPVVSDGQ